MRPNPDNEKKKVFIVDDHPLVREWLANLINQQSDLKVCGEAGSASEGLKLMAKARPHLAVVDISMEGGSGLELIKNINLSSSEVAILVLSMHDEMVYAERALRAGARGYIMKRKATRDVIQAIRRVLKGNIYVSEKIALTMAEKFVEGKMPVKGSPVALLSDRELEVFNLIGRGLSTRQIAEEMQISFRTVQSFSARIKEKLGLAHATALMREAVLWHDSQNLK